MNHERQQEIMLSPLKRHEKEVDRDRKKKTVRCCEEERHKALQITEIELAEVTESNDIDELSAMSEASTRFMAASTVGRVFYLSTLATMSNFIFDR